MYTKNLNVEKKIRLSESDYDKLSRLAAERGVGISSLIRYIIRDYLRRFNMGEQ